MTIPLWNRFSGVLSVRHCTAIISKPKRIFSEALTRIWHSTMRDDRILFLWTRHLLNLKPIIITYIKESRTFKLNNDGSKMKRFICSCTGIWIFSKMVFSLKEIPTLQKYRRKFSILQRKSPFLQKKRPWNWTTMVHISRSIHMAAPDRLELTTLRLTAECSTDWAKGQYGCGNYLTFRGEKPKVLSA